MTSHDAIRRWIAVLGLVIKGFLWLVVIGFELFVVAVGWGWLKRNTGT
ncbi:hypothetical protein Rhow_008510 [Rhodococcus wratislaviensis]|uniref:Uncharacterized protein n=1 Tax=Rhodococcus wratislaviensis TaxID=44752 RepID=A0A402CKR5_RHOWR|nr:hypothetical protein [Rhodococcus wratislaviensis]GCE44212.1 hypothetical protein Rhow_008510 [Rhodococcus wratislaviensis]